MPNYLHVSFIFVFFGSMFTFYIFLLQNDISDVPDLTFSIDADEEKLILYERTQAMIISTPFFNC